MTMTKLMMTRITVTMMVLVKKEVMTMMIKAVSCVYHEDASIRFHLTALKIRMHCCRVQLEMGYISLPYFHLDLCKNENILQQLQQSLDVSL